MRKLLATLTVVALASLNPAHAVSKEENIQKLLEITGTERLVREQIARTWPTIWTLVKKAHPEIPDNLFGLLESEFVLAMDESIPGYIEGAVDIYSKYFSEEEIEGLLNWYSTDLGKKSIEVRPFLLSDVGNWAQAWAKEIVVPKGLERIRGRLQAEGYQL